MDVLGHLRRGYHALVSRWSPPPRSTAAYERRARREIDALKNPEPSPLRSILNEIHKPMASATSALLHNKVGEAVSKAVKDVMALLDESAAWSAPREHIYRRFREAGYPVHGGGDIQRLELRQVDRMVEHLAPRNESLAFAEGAGTAFVGLPGAALDVPGLLTIALRTINEYATYYGFDTSRHHERAFVFLLLGTASAPTVEERRRAMTDLSRVSTALSTGDAGVDSDRLLSSETVTEVANAIATRLVQAVLLESLPVVDAGLGAAYNAWLTRTVAHTARELYRERFLIEKRGSSVAVPVRDPAAMASRRPQGGAAKSR
jgi:hypothetical protein